MKARYGTFVFIVAGGITLQFAYVNCGGFKQEYKLDAATESVLNSSAFNEVLTDFPLGDVTTTADGVTEVRREAGTGRIDTGIPTAPTPTPTPGPTPTPTPEPTPLACAPRNTTYDMMVARIKSTAPGDFKTDVPLNLTKGCEVSLRKYSVNSVDADGKTVRAMNQGGTTINMYCKLKNDGMMQIGLVKFGSAGLRTNRVLVSHICRAGTDPKACNPTHADYLFGLEYGKYGHNKKGANTVTKNIDAMDVIAKIHLSDTQVQPTELCHDFIFYSPLVIEKKFGAGLTTLDPKANETYFDLTGTGKKERISCVTGGAFLTLPDGAGEIRDINQLFGDQTVGPDGKKSANGFEALSKYDKKALGEGFGAITKKDDIFHKLRLWEDRNCNGLAEREELDGLEAYDVEAIRWIDHVEMNQIDSYGNATRQRNITFTKNGGHLRIFDLWFRSGYGTR